MNGDSSEAFAAADERGIPGPNGAEKSEVGDELRLIELVREHPWPSVLAAAGLGFLLARLFRSRE